jgi:hypothetical protein
VQGTGTAGGGSFANHPGQPITVIKDFGTVLMDGDKTFSASVSFEDQSTGDQYGEEGPLPAALPSTGGLALAALGAGVLAIAAGLALRSRR